MQGGLLLALMQTSGANPTSDTGKPDSLSEHQMRAKVWDSYTRKGDKIGAGGFGFVFGATHKGTGETVAIKAGWLQCCRGCSEASSHATCW